MNFSIVGDLFKDEKDYYRFAQEQPKAAPGEYLLKRRPYSNYLIVERADGSSKTLAISASLTTSLLQIGIPKKFQDQVLNKVYSSGFARVKVKNSETWGVIDQNKKALER